MDGGGAGGVGLRRRNERGMSMERNYVYYYSVHDGKIHTAIPIDYDGFSHNYTEVKLSDDDMVLALYRIKSEKFGKKNMVIQFKVKPENLLNVFMKDDYYYDTREASKELEEYLNSGGLTIYDIEPSPFLIRVPKETFMSLFDDSPFKYGLILKPNNDIEIYEFASLGKRRVCLIKYKEGEDVAMKLLDAYREIHFLENHRIKPVS